jgi:opacity protein-like surface antigen
MALRRISVTSDSRTNTNSVVLLANTALGGGGGVCGSSVTTTCVGSYSTTVSTDWLLTVRPRIGFAWDRTLAYATLGLAVTQLKFSQTYTDNITYFLIPGNTGAGGFVQMSASAVKTASSSAAAWNIPLPTDGP